MQSGFKETEASAEGTVVSTRRDRELVPEPFTTSVVIIGCGAVGKQVARLVAATTPSEALVVDPDIVEEHNIHTQGWFTKDVGDSKAEIVEHEMWSISPDTAVAYEALKFQHISTVAAIQAIGGHPLAIFMCVDSIEQRREVLDEIDKRQLEPKLIIDGRQHGENIRVESHESTESLRLSLPETDAGLNVCGVPGSLYVSSITAGLMVASYCTFFRNDGVADPIQMTLGQTPVLVAGRVSAGFA